MQARLLELTYILTFYYCTMFVPAHNEKVRRDQILNMLRSLYLNSTEEHLVFLKSLATNTNGSHIGFYVTYNQPLTHWS